MAFFLLPLTTAFAVFAALAFVVLLCYGGGFGTMPTFAADHFGAKRVGAFHGTGGDPRATFALTRRHRPSGTPAFPGDHEP